jgi:hypothetical protein
LFTPGYNDAPMVNQHRTVNDPDGELPQSAKNRKPSSDPAGDLRMRDMQHLVLDCIQRSGNPVEAIAEFRRALASVEEQFGVRKMSLDGDGADDLPVDDDEADRTNSGGSDEPTLAVIYEVLDNLERAGGKGKSVTASGRVMAEARALLRIICDNLQAVRERSRRRGGNVAGIDASNTVANTESAYKEASPAFSAMSLSRPQSDAEAERIVDQMFERKFYRPEAK